MRLEPVPGVVNKRSLRSNQVNWREANLVRWNGETLEPVLGWEAVNYDAADFESRIRTVHRWADNSGIQHIAYLCEQHCYVDSGDGLVDITPVDGLASPISSGEGGYGDASYGTSTYGDPRDAANRLDFVTPCYTLDNWGQELRAMTSADGRLLKWDPDSPSDPLVAVTDAPTANRTFVVTPERHVMLFGAGGIAQSFEWSDEEDDTEWTPGTTTKSGGFTFEPAAPVAAVQLTPNGTVMFSSRASYIISYIGLPYVYNYEKIEDCPPPYSAASVCEIPDGAFWAAINGFWLYNGVSAAPVDCPIWDWVLEQINQDKTKFEASMVHIAPKFEVWWFFVAGDSATVNNRMVIYNYHTGTWSMGKLSRNCGFSVPNDPYPLLAADDVVYSHEKGFVYPGADELPWVESFTIRAADGDSLTTIHQMVPEVVGTVSSVNFLFYKRNVPTDGSEVVTAAKTVRSNGYVDVRETARDFRLRVQMVAAAFWSLGPIEMILKKRGKK